MARKAPLKATGEPRAPTFNTSELLQTSRASPGWAWTRSGRRLSGTFGRPGGKLPSEHIEVESGKNNDRQQRDRREIGGATAVGYFRTRSLTEGGYVAWVLRLVEI